MVYIQIPAIEVGAYPSSQAIIESKSLKSMVVYRGANVGYFVGEGAKGSFYSTKMNIKPISRFR